MEVKLETKQKELLQSLFNALVPLMQNDTTAKDVVELNKLEELRSKIGLAWNFLDFD